MNRNDHQRQLAAMRRRTSRTRYFRRLAQSLQRQMLEIIAKYPGKQGPFFYNGDYPERDAYVAIARRYYDALMRPTKAASCRRPGH